MQSNQTQNQLSSDHFPIVFQNHEQLVKYREDLVQMSKDVKIAATQFHSQSIQRYDHEKAIEKYKQNLEHAEEKMKELAAAKSSYETLIAEMNDEKHIEIN
uniref:Uncharacterized protein n=2 Tax=Meloidogyne TaxID=189290 RepID=A0A6V7XXE5_MELEN|nr:unnamed protein product [Meloidogyne enterolobii]CAD2180653.1 unnamed protein product [Meloidogyne enterolobii]CAD2203986.1 unnamed protein product [Meloidogyne enterolobii]